jgi:two-component system, OmpR family, alkaline phosphatase synthesis response regulator PhoP
VRCQVSTVGKKQILVVDDEPDLRELVRYNLEQEGFVVSEAEDGERALEMIRRTAPALVVLDVMLPGASGLDICRVLRSQPQTAKLPILMLTAKSGEVERILGLEIGADDYVTKPFSPRELVARIRAVLRRSETAEVDRPHDAYARGRLRIDFDTYEAQIDGQPLELSLREFELLKFFTRNSNRVFDRLAILDLVWGQDTYVEPRTVDVHIRRLRLQIERDPANPDLIQTVRGVGYRFNDQALDA